MGVGPVGQAPVQPEQLAPSSFIGVARWIFLMEKEQAAAKMQIEKQ